MGIVRVGVYAYQFYQRCADGELSQRNGQRSDHWREAHLLHEAAGMGDELDAGFREHPDCDSGMDRAICRDKGNDVLRRYEFHSV